MSQPALPLPTESMVFACRACNREICSTPYEMFSWLEALVKHYQESPNCRPGVWRKKEADDKPPAGEREKAMTAQDGEGKRVRIDLTIELPVVSPQGVGWREALDGTWGLVARTLYGKVVSERVHADP